VRTELSPHLASLPAQLARAVDTTYRGTMDHFLNEEWDDAQVDAGRFCEACLRYLEWKMSGKHTAIDGKSKPDRKKTVNAARNDKQLTPSLRAQLPQAIELIMDFRNNRNSAHLGDIDPNKMDSVCVVQTVTWAAGEIVRIETQLPVVDVQRMLDRLAERHIPLVQTVGDDEVVLAPKMSSADKVVVLLHRKGEAVPMPSLRVWAEYGNASRFRTDVIKGLEKLKYVHVNKKTRAVTLLRPGEARAQRLLLDEAA
jgi:hypothetical protein